MSSMIEAYICHGWSPQPEKASIGIVVLLYRASDFLIALGLRVENISRYPLKQRTLSG